MATAQQIAELQQFVQQQSAEITLLRQQLTAIEARDPEQVGMSPDEITALLQGIPAPVVNFPASQPREPRGADPERFTGDRSKCESFIRAVSVNLALQPHTYHTTRAAVLYTLSWIGSDNHGHGENAASQWATNIVSRMITPGTPQLYATWDEFIADFRLAWGQPDRAENARLALSKLSQDRLTAEEYTAQFNAHATLTGFDEVSLLHLYQTGLTETLAAKIWSIRPVPTTLADWKSAARDLDNQWRRFRQQHAHTDRRTVATPRPVHTPAPAPVTARPAAPLAPVAMDVDALRRTGLCHN